MTDDGYSLPKAGDLPGEGAAFADLFNRFWDSLIDDGVTARQVDRIEQHLALGRGARVAVVPSGCGRLALELAARGHDVIGIDRSADAIERSRALAAQAGLGVTFRHCEALSFAAADACDGAVCLSHGVGLAVLAAQLGTVLKPGAGALVAVDEGAGSAVVSTMLASFGLEAIAHVAGLDDGAPHAAGRLLVIRRRD